MKTRSIVVIVYICEIRLQLNQSIFSDKSGLRETSEDSSISFVQNPRIAVNQEKGNIARIRLSTNEEVMVEG
jgi:hypothetical protein